MPIAATTGPTGTGFDRLRRPRTRVYSLYGIVGRQLSRTSEVNFNAFASWYDSDLPALDDVTTIGATVSYNRSLPARAAAAAWRRSASTTATTASTTATNASALGGLRYTF